MQHYLRAVIPGTWLLIYQVCNTINTLYQVSQGFLYAGMYVTVLRVITRNEGPPCVAHLCRTAHEKKRRTSPSVFSCTTFRHSAISPSAPSIQKRTTRRWNSVGCAYYCVAKRQQFSCPVRTVTSSLKFGNVFPESWIRVFPCYI